MQAVWKGQTKEFSFHNSYYILDRGTIGKETFPVVPFSNRFCCFYKNAAEQMGAIDLITPILLQNFNGKA